MAAEHGSRVPGTSDLADVELARRIANAGGEPAFAEEAELCRRYARRLHLYGLRHLRADDRARDLVQDVLVVALEKLRCGAVRDPERIGSFMLGVARMTARTMNRTRSKETDLAVADEPTVAANALAVDPLARDLVVRCLEALAEKHRSVIVLTYFAEQPTAAIASSLGMSANNVRVTRHRGIAQLRTCLGFGDIGTAA
jgi:RNA polymerase sigma-70 factor (ECF subfamily)